MGEVIKTDFQTGEVIDRKSYVSTSGERGGAHTLREIKTSETADRHELMEQAAFVAAGLDIAKTETDELETYDLEITLQDCMAAFDPALQEHEIDEIRKRAVQIINDLTDTIG